MQSVNFGIIGAGRIAKRMANAIKWTPGVSLKAIASTSLERAQQFAHEFGAKDAYGSYEQMAQDKEIDVIYIATLHKDHYENALMCLEKGKNLLIEKPITMNKKQAKILFQKAAEKRLFIMEGMWTRLLPSVLYVKEAIRKGHIGEVRSMTVSFGVKRDAVSSPRQFNRDLAGGALLDIGIYCLAFSDIIFEQKPQEIYSACYISDEYKTDLEHSVILKYANGQQAMFNCSICNYYNNTAFIYGTKGHIEMPRFNACQKVIVRQLEEYPLEIAFPHKVCGFEYELEHVAKCIREGAIVSDVNPPDATLSIMEQMDTIRAAWNLNYPCE